MKKKIAVLAGDGIGPEIMEEALKVLTAVGSVFGHEFEFEEALIGGAAWEVYESHFPQESIDICEKADAILFGSVGGPVDRQMDPKWKNCEARSILAVRNHFNFNINLRPVKIYSQLKDACVIRAEIIDKGVDILCVRELSQDVYFGDHGIEGAMGERVATDLMVYDEEVIEKIAHVAFKAAMKRKMKVTSVDKANVLSCSKLWREVVDRVAQDYPECKFENMLVDNLSMQVIRRPYDFDVLLMPNMFGDIISDEVSVFSSLGMLPSASLNEKGFGLYEPSSGSAPDIAGKGLANPIGQILSAAMMLKYSFGMHSEHDAIVRAVGKALDDGYRTRDIALEGHTFASTDVLGDAICKNIKK